MVSESQEGKTTCKHLNDETSSLLDDLSPFSFHTLSQRQIKYFAYAIARLRATLRVLGADFFCDGCTLLRGNGGETLGGKHARGLGVLAEIDFCTDEDEGCTVAEVGDFGIPLQEVRTR